MPWRVEILPKSLSIFVIWDDPTAGATPKSGVVSSKNWKKRELENLSL